MTAIKGHNQPGQSKASISNMDNESNLPKKSEIREDHFHEENFAASSASACSNLHDNSNIKPINPQTPPKKNDDTTTQKLYKTFQEWIYSFVIGSLVVTYWRGAWTLFDIYSCHADANGTLLNGDVFCFSYDIMSSVRKDSALWSLGIGYLLTIIGKFLYQRGWFDNSIDSLQGATTSLASLSPSPTTAISRVALALRRIINLQIIALGGIFTWRGYWYLSDYYIYPDNILLSSWLTGILGCLGMIALFSSSSVCGAPAVPPFHDPCTVPFDTIGSSIFNQLSLAKDFQTTYNNLVWTFVDTIATYIALPLFEVWFYRGIWLVEDMYLWGYTSSFSDLRYSLWAGAVIFFVGLILNGLLDFSFKSTHPQSKSGLLRVHCIRRLQDVVLGIASVSFWRLAWYSLEVLLIPDQLSTWISFLLSWSFLVALGGFANTVFPAVVDVMNLSSIPLAMDESADATDSVFAILGIAYG